MSIESTAAIARAMARIDELRTAVTLNSCRQLHAGVTGYCQALLDCGVISQSQWQLLTDLADARLTTWRPTRDIAIRLPGWQAKDYR